MLLEKERCEIVEYGKKLIEDGLTNGTSGNISIYNREKNLMAISPSGIAYFDTRPEDIVIMNLDGEIVEGSKKASSEWALHSEIYKVKDECQALVHTHSMYCTVFACLGQPLKALHYVVADAGSSQVKCAPYQTYGTKELAISAAETIGKSNALLLANHGMLACGKDLKSAYSLAATMEYCAQLQYRCMCIGNANLLDDQEMEKVIEKFKSYGQSK